jgi:hypothetical protein
MPRAEERTGVMVRATLRDGGGSREACVLDVSTRGLLLTTARPPARGEFVEIAIGDSRLAGQVKWSAKRRFGIALRDRVSVIAFLEGGQGPLELAKARTDVGPRRGPQAEERSRDWARAVQLVAIAIGGLACAVTLMDVIEAAFAPVSAGFAIATR